MEEPQLDIIEPEVKPVSRFSRWSGIVLMVAILGVAAIVSALTAMRFAIRGREVEVPPLAGKTADQAKEILARNGLLFKVASSQFSAQVPEGQILAQIPPSGTRIKANRTVRVLVSLGERRVAVPNLIGTSLRAAQLTLAQRKLALGKTLYAHTGDGDSSTVVYQTPPPGTQEGADPSVNILISLGPPAEYFIMPDLIGKSADLVASRARNEGFHLAKVNYRKYPGVEPGLVIQQKPQAGYRLTKSDIILLDVSQ
jgi:beta-lactam-binding protein with PASTA domain